MDAPLSGLVVLALEQAVAAPFCTMRLADAGARVIKVERPGGDFARHYDEATPAGSSYFVWLNRGKESIVLDLGLAEDRSRLSDLVASADILVQNLKPGAVARLGFSSVKLRADFPRLICCSISGYGDDGPLASRKAYDLLVQAESGLASITGGPDEPSRVGISIVDIATGATAYAAILEALIGRSRTGTGADIRLSMFDVMADWLTAPLLAAESGHPPGRMGLAHPSIAPYGLFPTLDGRQLLIAVQSDREWRLLCTEVLGQPDLVDDPRFVTNVLRVAHRSDTDDIVAGVVGALNANEVIERLDQASIAFAELNDIEALARHSHLSRMMIETVTGLISIPRPAPISMGGARVYGSVPGLGQHTKAILSEFCGKDHGR
jgi:formyl-CoA transferase